MNRDRGFTLIEVMVVLAIVAISLGIAGPRIGAGIGRFELNRAAQTVRNSIKLARIEAQRADAGHYVVLDSTKGSVAVLDADLQVKREDTIADSVQFVLQGESRLHAVYVAPTGMTRGLPVRLRGRSGEVEVALP